MVAVAVSAKVSGPPTKKRPPVILNDQHMKAIGETIAAPLRANLASGLDADGQPLAPEVRGDGIPGHETGALAASIKARRTRKGKLVVMPDYKRFKYGAILAIGVDTARTKKAIAEGRLQKRKKDYVRSDYVQPARPFMGMSSGTLDRVADANAETFKGWVENIGKLGSGISEAPTAMSAAPGALSKLPGAL